MAAPRTDARQQARPALPPAALALGALAVAAGLVLALAPLMTALPAWCPFRLATGWPCPLCGLTRSLAALGRGDVSWALYNYPLLGAAALAGIAGALAPARAWLARHGLGLLLTALALNWAYRLFVGMQ